MNIEKMTIKFQRALEQAQSLAVGRDHRYGRIPDLEKQLITASLLAVISSMSSVNERFFIPLNFTNFL